MQDLLRLVAGAAPAEPRFVVWEGTRYRVDIAHAEAIRVSRLLGEDARPYASSAVQLVKMADALGRAALTVDEVKDHRRRALCTRSCRRLGRWRRLGGRCG